MALEKMDDFFNHCTDGYEEHQKTAIESANEFYHYDTPLTRQHETEVLLKAGFSCVEFMNQWGNTKLLKAYK